MKTKLMNKKKSRGARNIREKKLKKKMNGEQQNEISFFKSCKEIQQIFISPGKKKYQEKHKFCI